LTRELVDSVQGVMRVAIISLALLLSSGAVTVFGQQLEGGVKVGPTIATVFFEPATAGNYGLIAPGRDEPYRRRVSVGGGGFVVLPVVGPLALQAEALFTPKGGKLPEGFNSSLIINYFEFPLLARITPFRSTPASVYVFGGASPGFRISAKYKIAPSPGGLTSGGDDDISSAIHRFELGVVAGGGVNVGRRLVIDARYSWGMSDINSSPEATLGVRNRTLTMLAGFRF
jgi:hypothetical protein